MDIAVLGTGSVGRAIAARLDELGHHVVVGTRDPRTTLDRTEPDGMGDPSYAVWQGEHPDGAALDRLPGCRVVRGAVRQPHVEAGQAHGGVDREHGAVGDHEHGAETSPGPAPPGAGRRGATSGSMGG